MKCLACSNAPEFENNRDFFQHIRSKHKISTEEYTIKFIHKGVRPTCQAPDCNCETRYKSFEFKRFCAEHGCIAESEGGKANIKYAMGWNKGQTKETNASLALQSERQMGERNHFFGKKHTKETMDKLLVKRKITKEDYEARLALRSNDFEITAPYEDYFSRQKQYLSVKCRQCGKEMKKTLTALERGSQCLKCHPVATDSRPEREIAEFIQSLGIEIVRSDRTVLKPKELDIYVPSKNLAIEHNGLHWHSELNVSNTHHYDKTMACKERGIQLVHIFSDEWAFKRDIVKSMIRNKLGVIENKVYARNCTVKQIEHSQANEFFETNHLSGNTKSRAYFGLFDKEQKLTSCLSLRVPRHKIYQGKIEIARFATTLDTVAVGGFSKLLKAAKEWCLKNKIEEIITYADLHTGTGNVYEKNGFEFVKNTEIDYWYTDNINRYDRFKYRANPEMGLTEKQVAELHEVFKVFGVGSALFKLSLKDRELLKSSELVPIAA